MKNLSPPALQITVYYIQADHTFQLQLEKHLSPIKNIEDLAVWLAVDVREEIAYFSLLNPSDIALLLMSSDFIASPFFSSAETISLLHRQQTQGGRILPLIVRPCLWQKTPLGKLQALPRNSKAITLWRNRDAAFLDVVIDIWKVVKTRVETQLHEIVSKLQKLEAKYTPKRYRMQKEKQMKPLKEAERYYATLLGKLQNAQAQLIHAASALEAENSSEEDASEGRDLLKKWKQILGDSSFLNP